MGTIASVPRHTGNSRLAEAALVVALTLIAFGIRWPYWRTVPAANDEAAQATFATHILFDGRRPLTANDTYTGPFFVYLIAGLFALGVPDPMVGRAVMLVAGTLTVPATFLWLRSLRADRVASSVAAGLVAANPHLVLFNSHAGAATFLLPFFTTVYLGLIAAAIDRDHPGWWLGAALAGGLALQSNLVAVFPVAGGWLWFAVLARRQPRLRRRWLAWLSAGTVVLGLVLSPVIVYNLSTAGGSAATLGERSYLWETNENALIYFDNLRRLLLQLGRQTGGVLSGEEKLADLFGLPLVLSAWAAAGLGAMDRRLRALGALACLPYIVVIPYFSNHYGTLEPVRFTIFMTPVLAGGMGALVSALARRMPRLRFGLAGAALLLAAGPLVGLFDYEASARGPENGAALLALSGQMVAGDPGAPVYLEYSEAHMLTIRGIPYVPQAYLSRYRVRNEFLPLDQIIGRLFEARGPALLLLSDAGADELRQVADLIQLPGDANLQARQAGYGLYALNTTTALRTPDFVLQDTAARAAAPQIALNIAVGGGLVLIGADLPLSWPAGAPLELALYWRKAEGLPPGRYIGFVHFLDSSGGLIAQSDHTLGSDRYPVPAWQAGEVIVDRHTLAVPAEAPAGQYRLRLGVYQWPSLERLAAPGHPDNLIELPPVTLAAP